MIPETVERHYLETFGRPSRTATFTRGGRKVDVFKWDAEATEEGVTLYATVGASKHPMQGMPSDHRVEYFLGLNPSRDEIAGALAALGLYAIEEQVQVGHGHTVPAGGPILPGTRMTSFLVLKPLTAVIPPLHLDGGLHVDFLQAIPVFASEAAFVSAHHADELLQEWQRSRVPFWDPGRQPKARLG